ncbi:MAG: 16S rRNA (uracil(1498)-N(3))-methyltransferase [Actinobacteria bacterium]|nr:16S rRNA (uracil(1498)-N(3))-methyltransferase [Actinomycetota bacterium]
MTTPRFYVSAADLEDDRVTLSGGDHHHLCRVLRARVGDEVWLLDGRGLKATARIERLGRESSTLKVTDRKWEEEERPRLHLFQSLLKGSKMDLVVEVAAELGAASITPFTCRYSQATTPALERRVERWRAVAAQSSRVAGRRYLPEVGDPVDWKELLRSLSRFGVTLFADERGGERVAHVLRECEAEELALIVGPEGGFEDAEREELCSLGARSVSLGPHVLRAEFAGMALIAAARCACGLM